MAGQTKTTGTVANHCGSLLALESRQWQEVWHWREAAITVADQGQGFLVQGDLTGGSHRLSREEDLSWTSDRDHKSEAHPLPVSCLHSVPTGMTGASLRWHLCVLLMAVRRDLLPIETFVTHLYSSVIIVYHMMRP